MNETFYVGTYTEKLPFVTGKSKGIYKCELDSTSGDFKIISIFEEIRNPSYLALDSKTKYLFAIEETKKSENPKIFSFLMSKTKLIKINSQSIDGGYPCHLILDKSNKFVFVANYETGNIVYFPIKKNGVIEKQRKNFQHKDSIFSNSNAKIPHAHAVVLSLDNKYLFVPDLGLDEVKIYDFNSTTGKLMVNKNPYVKTHDGSGPRHLVFHPSGKYAFLVNETNLTIVVYSYVHGHLNPLQTIDTLEKKDKKKSTCAEILITKDGKYVFASNRGHNSITSFLFENGVLKNLGYTSSMGQTPRDFAISSSGKFLIVANQDSSNIATFLIDYKTGELNFTGFLKNIPHPVCILPI